MGAVLLFCAPSPWPPTPSTEAVAVLWILRSTAEGSTGPNQFPLPIMLTVYNDTDVRRRRKYFI